VTDNEKHNINRTDSQHAKYLDNFIHTTTDFSGDSMSEKLNRIIIEAGKYLGKTAGEEIDRGDVISQAEANGYGPRESQAMVPSKQKITIPRQNELFGDWPDNESNGDVIEETETDNSDCGKPGVDTQNVPILSQFQDYRSNNTYIWNGTTSHDHTFNQTTARKKFARAKSVDRHFNREYDTFSTVLITYCMDDSDAPIAQQAKSFYPRAVVRKRRQILKDLGVYDSYAGLEVLAPKYTDDIRPGANSPRTHAHSFLWIPGTVSPDAFHELIEEHIKKVDGASVDQHTTSDNCLTGASITVEHWGTQGRVPTPQGPMDIKRGPTSSLPYELKENLPWLKHPNADYVNEWSAALWQGPDERTIQRFKPMGRPSRFKELADRGKYEDRLREAHHNAQAIAGMPCVDSPPIDTITSQASGNHLTTTGTTIEGTEQALREAVAKLSQVT
jgi:hypothetical protein